MQIGASGLTSAYDLQVESGVGTIASDESASLAALYLQIGRGCQSARSVCIGMDYNANINRIVAGLPDGRKVNVINSFYVKFERHGWIVEAVYIGNPMKSICSSTKPLPASNASCPSSTAKTSNDRIAIDFLSHY